MGLWIGIHLLAATIWVGGMFFAHQCLRPAAESHLPPPLRLVLWRAVLRRFFLVVWIAIILLLISGYVMVFIYLGGMAKLSLHVHLMQFSGLVMVVIFLYIYFVPYRGLIKNIDNENFGAAGGQQAKIRRFVGINLIIGLITMFLGATGQYLSFIYKI